jgi:hypothetical protein
MSEDIKVPLEFVTLNGDPVISFPISGTIKPLIPWRKPEERPEDGRECLVLEEDGTIWLCFYYERYDGFGIDDGGTCRRLITTRRMDTKAWCYVDELPLPYWVQK